MSLLIKKKIIDEVIISLLVDISDIEKSIAIQHGLLQDSPNAMQSWSDTTRSQKEELISGLNKQLNEKNVILSFLRNFKIETNDTIKSGSLIEIQENDDSSLYFVIPGSKSNKISFKDKEVTIISPGSLIAKSLYSRKKDEEVQVKVPAGIRKLKIIKVE
jgi:transcription elongation GreA/GreB family factor